MFAIAFFGQKIMGKINITANPNGFFKKFLGFIFLVIGFLIISGYDKKIEAYVIESGYYDFTGIEHDLLEKNEAKKKN